MNSALRAQALARLGVTAEQVAALPQITPQLRMIQRTLRRAGQPRITRRMDNVLIEESTEHQAPYGPGADICVAWPSYLAASDSLDAKRVLAVYYALPKTLRTTNSGRSPLTPIEAFCCAAEVSPLLILEIITGCCVRFGVQASTIIAAVNHPRVVQKSIEMALTDDGLGDRTLLSRATGFLPTPHGTTVNVAANASAKSEATAQQATIVAAPPPEQTIRRLQDRFNEGPRTLVQGMQRALPAPASSPLDFSTMRPAREPVPVMIDDTDEESI